MKGDKGDNGTEGIPGLRGYPGKEVWSSKCSDKNIQTFIYSLRDHLDHQGQMEQGEWMEIRVPLVEMEQL